MILTPEALITGRVCNNKQVIQLTRHEMIMFYLLNTNPDGMEWKTISMFLWGEHALKHSKVIGVHLFNLRTKLKPRFEISYTEKTKLYRLVDRGE